MIDESVHLSKFVFRVVFQQMAIVFSHFDHFHYVVVQLRWFELAVGFLAQMEDSQTRGQILIVWAFAGDQVGGGLDDGFVDIGGLDAVVKLDVGTQFYLRNRDIM
ncbi:hypothetical protein HAT93_04195 [Dickeya solani]|nr:hypothetical protein [Dickeya solani]